jgi:protein TonB
MPPNPTKELSRLNLYIPATPAAAGTKTKSNEDNDLLKYCNYIKEWINTHKIYPRTARIKGFEGVALVSFSISETGRLIDAELVSSSSHEILDMAAIKTINNSDPFPPFPTGINESELRLNLAISYRLN